MCVTLTLAPCQVGSGVRGEEGEEGGGSWLGGVGQRVLETVEDVSLFVQWQRQQQRHQFLRVGRPAVADKQPQSPLSVQPDTAAIP